jgi:hypothetical protein
MVNKQINYENNARNRIFMTRILQIKKNDTTKKGS